MELPKNKVYIEPINIIIIAKTAINSKKTLGKIIFALK